jgi:hypothetical protein
MCDEVSNVRKLLVDDLPIPIPLPVYNSFNTHKLARTCWLDWENLSRDCSPPW